MKVKTAEPYAIEKSGTADYPVYLIWFNDRDIIYASSQPTVAQHVCELLNEAFKLGCKSRA